MTAARLNRFRSGFVVSRDERTLEPITPSEFAFTDEAGWAWHIDWLEGRQDNDPRQRSAIVEQREAFINAMSGRAAGMSSGGSGREPA